MGGPDGYLSPVQFLDHLTVIKMIRYIGDDLGANMGGMINWGDSKCPDQVILSDVVGDEVISMNLHKCGKLYFKTTITH